ncbi:hypothetical protein [Nocardia gamkensis]|uniref:hypothetical protein n=1 Tax=Nocardia gamkensis TaxID=352869 RepID=UPI001FDEFFC6|nr:hypothetical protein [Nocardia gamkensis]
MDVVVFVVDGVADFGYAALLETFNTANAVRTELADPPQPWRIRSASFGTTVRSGNGNTVPTIPLDELGDEFELMIVPAVNVLEAAALIELISAPASRPVLDRLVAARDRGAHLAAACTGTFFLAEAGVLDAPRRPRAGGSAPASGAVIRASNWTRAGRCAAARASPPRARRCRIWTWRCR